MEHTLEMILFRLMVKFKSRYILVEIESVSGSRISLTPSALFSCIAENVGEFHGDRGFAFVRSGLAVCEGEVLFVHFFFQM